MFTKIRSTLNKSTQNGKFPINEMGNTPLVNQFIQIDNVSKSFLEGSLRRDVLKNASATIAKGEFVGILGQSGSGKSTLLNVISGIDYPENGTIWVDDQNLTFMDEHDRTIFRRNHIGFIFQFFNLIPTLTVWENVLLPLELSGKADENGINQAESMLKAVDLYHRRDTFPDRLSGGEQQRIAIARALVHDPLLVLADEPTGNLDEETGKQVLELLDRLTRKQGKNLIMVTHSVEAASYADRLLTLRDGRFFEE
jgi:putative ABC transport system ATP-binding protein